MAYLGRGIENLSDRVVLDSLTASATASYTLQLNSVNFVPSSAESLTVSLNGVIQKPNSSYTVSSSTLTFSSSLSSSDSIDFIIAERGITLQTPSAGSVGTSQLANGAVTSAKIDSSVALGKVLQVVSTSKTDTFTSTSTGSFIDITGLSLSITPSSTSSKILISFNIQGGASSSNYANLRLVRDSTAIGVGDADGSRLQTTTGFRITVTASQTTFSNQFLDSPSSTSSLTYKLQVYNNTSGTITVNRSYADSNNASHGRNISTITAMEIAG